MSPHLAAVRLKCALVLGKPFCGRLELGFELTTPTLHIHIPPPRSCRCTTSLSRICSLSRGGLQQLLISTTYGWIRKAGCTWKGWLSARFVLTGSLKRISWFQQRASRTWRSVSGLAICCLLIGCCLRRWHVPLFLSSEDVVYKCCRPRAEPSDL